MDEEGVEVYYEGSPSASHLEPCSELIIGDGKEEEEEKNTKSHLTAGRLRVWLLNFLFRPLHETCCLSTMTSELRVSPLLTNEDHHLLHSALASQNIDGHTPNHTLQTSSLSWTPKHWNWCSAITALLSVLISVILATSSSFKVLFLLLLLIPLLLSLWHLTLGWWVWLLEGWAKRDRSKYYHACDCLLTQLSASLRWLQEVEVIGQGFARPLPLLRHGNQSYGWNHAYRHAHLRQCLLVKVSHLVRVLRAATRRMHLKIGELGCGQGWLGEELLERRSYLAFTNLSNLHPHLTEEEEEEGQEETSVSGDDKALQLDSLKDVCSLVGVQNSELLRLLCLSAVLADRRLLGGAGDARGVVSKMRGVVGGVRLVRWLSVCLGDLVKEVELVTQEVTSALIFNQNMLLEPPPTPSTVGGATKVTSDLQRVLDQVHCLDLKTHCMLHRVRSLKESLCSGRYEVGGLKMAVESISVCVGGVADSCDVLMSMIQQKNHTHQQEEEEEVGSDVNLEGGVTTDGISSVNVKRRGSDSSESECYSCEGHLGSEDEDPGQGVEEEQLLEKQEVPVWMLRELQSVLTLRKEEKERRRQQRKITRQSGIEHAQFSRETEVEGCQVNLEQPDENICLEEGVALIKVAGYAESAAVHVDTAKSADNHHEDHHTGTQDHHTGRDTRLESHTGNCNSAIGQDSFGIHPFSPHGIPDQLKLAIMHRRNQNQEETFS